MSIGEQTAQRKETLQNAGSRVLLRPAGRMRAHLLHGCQIEWDGLNYDNRHCRCMQLPTTLSLFGWLHLPRVVTAR